MLYFNSDAATFYDTDVHGEGIPAGSIEVTSDQRRDLIAAIANGHPVACVAGVITIGEVPAPSPDSLAEDERTWRDAEMQSNEWLVARHRDEQDMQLATTLTAEQFAELLVYRQALRDWPQSEAFPDSAQRPVAPPWIAEQTQ